MSTDTEQPSKRDRQKARRADRLSREAEEAKKGAAGRLTAKILMAVAAVVLITGVGFLLMRGTGATQSDVTLGVEAAAAADDTPSLPSPTGSGREDIAVGAMAPTVAGQSFDGSDITIGGQPQAQAIVFLAHWCPHCQAEVPLIKDWVDQGLLTDDVQLVAVSTLHDTARPNWPPDEWLQREEFPGDVLVDHDGTAAEAYGLQGTPMWAFVDDQGTVVARWPGQIDAEQFSEGIALATAASG